MDGLLFLAHRLPYPPDKGDKIRSWHVLEHLARRYRVHLGAFVDDPADHVHEARLRALCAECCFIPLSPLRARMSSLAALAGGGPLTCAYYHSARLRRWVRELHARGALNLVYAFSGAMAQFMPEDARLPRVMDFVDVDSDKWRQLAMRSHIPAAWLYRREAASLARFERAVANDCDASLFVTEAEARLFRAQAPESAARVHAIENGVDGAYFDPAREHDSPYAAGEAALVFTGAMDYSANVDAVCWFAREVFPAIHAARSDARFYIVGTRPTPAVKALAREAGVLVTGTVPDVRPWLAHARFAVAPLRIARGMQNKVLEALAMGRAVLATREAAEGIELDVPALAVAADAEDYARRALDWLARGTPSSARDAVLARYGWPGRLARLDALLETLDTGRRREDARAEPRNTARATFGS